MAVTLLALGKKASGWSCMGSWLVDHFVLDSESWHHSELRGKWKTWKFVPKHN